VKRRRPDRRIPADEGAPGGEAGWRLVALRLLNRRDHCAAELAARLVERGAAPNEAGAVVARLVEERLLDDARFAEHYVAAHAERGQGPLRIAQELAGRGMSAEVVERAVAARDESWKGRCAALRRRRFGETVPEEWAERARQARFLQYRGFSADQIRAALGRDVELEG
jgi:regulatory protein